MWPARTKIWSRLSRSCVKVQWLIYSISWGRLSVSLRPRSQHWASSRQPWDGWTGSIPFFSLLLSRTSWLNGSTTMRPDPIEMHISHSPVAQDTPQVKTGENPGSERYSVWACPSFGSCGCWSRGQLTKTRVSTWSTRTLTLILRPALRIPVGSAPHPPTNLWLVGNGRMIVIVVIIVPHSSIPY